MNGKRRQTFRGNEGLDVVLLPCPMCGGTDIRTERLSCQPKCSVWCYTCRIRTRWCDKEEAISAWNTRVGTQHGEEGVKCTQ